MRLWIIALGLIWFLPWFFAWANRVTARRHARFTAREVENALTLVVDCGDLDKWLDEWSSFRKYALDDPHLESIRQECLKIDMGFPSDVNEEGHARVAGLLADLRSRMRTTALLLPEAVRRNAAVGFGGEHAWRQHDVEEVFQQARTAGLACLGGKVQFQLREGTCDAHWLTFDPKSRGKGEAWSEYVSRSSAEALDGFRRLCRRTDLRAVAQDWALVRDKVERESYDPLRDLWFVLYFATEHRASDQRQ